MTTEKLKELLTLYSERLERHGYTDSDWRDEKPTSIEKFFRDCGTQIAEILNPKSDGEIDIITLQAYANRCVQEVMNKGQKLTSAEQIGLYEMCLSIGRDLALSSKSGWATDEDMIEFGRKCWINGYDEDINKPSGTFSNWLAEYKQNRGGK